MGEPENEASSEADQGSDQLESDRETGPQSKNAYDPHAKRKKRSEIWDHFAQAAGGGKCNYCKVNPFVKGTSSNLFSHLRTNHKRIYDATEFPRQKVSASQPAPLTN